MRKFAIAGFAAALVFVEAAFAADMPVKAPPKVVPAQLFSWTGFYVGGHFGYGWAFPELIQDVTFTPVLDPPRPRGILGGGQVGYNWQAGPWVYGIEGDFTWSDVAGSSVCILPFGTISCRGVPDEYSTIAGRLGYAADRLLLYVKGGAAWMDEGFKQLSITLPTCVGTPCIGSNSTWGWMTGAGIEYELTPHWTIRAEYNFLDFGTWERVTVTNGATANIFSITRTFDLIKFGVNYRFGDWSWGPLATRY